MRIDWLGPVHRADDRQLAEGVVEVVVAADDVRDAHVMIVDHHREHIGRGAVRAQQDEVVELGIGDLDLPLDEVVDHRLAGLGGLDPHDERLARLVGARLAIAPFAVDPEGASFGLRRLAPRRQLILSQITAIGRPARNQFVRDFGVALLELRLKIRLAVAFDPEPRQPVEDRVDRRLGRALGVGVLDPQQILAAMMPREQPVEQGRPRPADVEETRRRGGEARHDRGWAAWAVHISACAEARFPLFCQPGWHG